MSAAGSKQSTGIHGGSIEQEILEHLKGAGVSDPEGCARGMAAIVGDLKNRRQNKPTLLDIDFLFKPTPARDKLRNHYKIEVPFLLNGVEYDPEDLSQFN